MLTLALEQETKNYWQLLKGASDQVKLSLISLLSSSLLSKEDVVKPSEEVLSATIRTEDLEITPFVASIGQNINPLPQDFDYDKDFSAKHENIDYLITRNKKDFETSDIPVYEPQEFVDFLLNERNTNN